MYSVQKDKRCIESCELIYRALLALLLPPDPVKDINTITVTELSNKSTVSRGTFYRHFDRPIDVLLWKSDSKISESCYVDVLMDDNHQFIRTFFEYWSTQHAFLNSLCCIDRLDLLLSSLEKNIASWSKLLFTGTHLDPVKEQYLIRIWAVIIWSILCTWVHRGRKESVKVLTDMAIHNLPDLHRQEIRPAFGEEISMLHGEIKFVAREIDIDHYRNNGCKDISWDDMPFEVVEDCASCYNKDSCNPHPMRYLRR